MWERPLKLSKPLTQEVANRRRKGLGQSFRQHGERFKKRERKEEVERREEIPSKDWD